MHKIEETKYGYKLVLEGFLQRDEVGQLLEAMKTKIKPREKGQTFPLLLDMRKSNAFPSDAREILKQCLLFCKESGMERNAVILSSGDRHAPGPPHRQGDRHRPLGALHRRLQPERLGEDRGRLAHPRGRARHHALTVPLPTLSRLLSPLPSRERGRG